MSKELTEADVYAALGWQPDQKPEAAAPAADAGSNGANGQTVAGSAAQNGIEKAELHGAHGGLDGGRSMTAPTAGDGGTVAAPVGDGGRPVTAPTGGGTGDPTPTGDGGTVAAPTTGDGGDAANAAEEGAGGMSREERARQAQLRRQRERDQAVQSAVAAARQEEQERFAAQLKDVFAQAGMTNRYDGGKPITTLEEFQAWQNQAQAERLSRELREGRLTPETFRQAVASSPAVQQALEAVQRMEQQAQAQTQAAQKQEWDAQVARELAEIHGIYPGVSSLEDILAMDTGEEFQRLVTQNNLSFTQAFRLANAEKLIKAQVLAAQEGQARQAHGKDHLRSVVAGGGVAVDVPPETVRLYRDLNPDMSMEQIRQDYSRRMKG